MTEQACKRWHPRAEAKWECWATDSPTKEKKRASDGNTKGRRARLKDKQWPAFQCLGTQGTWGPLRQRASQNNEKTGGIISQSRICHLLHTHHKQKHALTEHVAGRKDINCMDRFTHKKKERNKTPDRQVTTYSSVMTTRMESPQASLSLSGIFGQLEQQPPSQRLQASDEIMHTHRLVLSNAQRMTGVITTTADSNVTAVIMTTKVPTIWWERHCEWKPVWVQKVRSWQSVETWVNVKVFLTSHFSIICEARNDPGLGMEEQTGWNGTATSPGRLSQSMSTRGLCGFIQRSFLNQ